MAKSPEERTTELFSKNFDVLWQNLRNRTVAIPGTSISIVLTELNPYSYAKNQDSWLYTPMKIMEEGDFYARYHPLRKMCLSLIVARDEGKVGACIQVAKASRIDSARRDPIPLPKQGDIAISLGLQKDEIGKLRFLDDTETLYLIRTGRILDRLPVAKDKHVSAGDADQALGRLVK